MGILNWVEVALIEIRGGGEGEARGAPVPVK